MNKQELIESYERVGNFSETVKIKSVIEKLKQLDEPQKVKVSEEEAKFLETFDFNCESDVTTALFHVSITGWGYYLKDNNGIDLKDLSEWLGELENRKRLIKAILDGYEVEQEKRYTVKMRTTKQPLFYNNLDKGPFFSLGELATQFTRKQLEELGLGWVFECPGIEIEEVE